MEPQEEAASEPANLRTMSLVLDDDDFDTIQGEITHRQVRSRAIAPTSPTILPDGDSNLAGALIAEVIRDLNEYRAIYDGEHPKTEENPDA